MRYLQIFLTVFFFYICPLQADQNIQKQINHLLTYDAALDVHYDMPARWHQSVKVVRVMASINIRDEQGDLPKDFDVIRQKASQRLTDIVAGVNALSPLKKPLLMKRDQYRSVNIVIILDNSPLIDSANMYFPTIAGLFDPNFDVGPLKKHFFEKIRGKKCFIMPISGQGQIVKVLILAQYDPINQKHFACMEKSLIRSFGVWGNKKTLKELDKNSLEIKALYQLYDRE